MTQRAWFSDNPDTPSFLVVGTGCGMCHDAIPASGTAQFHKIEELLQMSVFMGTPMNEVFSGYVHQPPPPQTPIPSPLLLMATPLLWLARKAVK